MEPSTVIDIDEKGEMLPSKETKYMGDVKILTACGPNRRDQDYRNMTSQDRMNSDQYHYQQNVAGQRVYVQGPPPPINASRQPALRPYEAPQATFDDDVFTNSFNTIEIRHQFVRKVYLILTTQLAFTAAVIGIFVFEPSVNRFAHRHFFVGYGIFIAGMVIYFILVCVQSARKNFPLNLILLALFTVLSSIGYGTISSIYSPDLVLYSAVITAGVCLLITFLACQTWFDITGCGMYLCIMGMVVMVFGIVAMIVSLTTGYGRIMNIIYSSLVALVVSLFFMYNTQLILGGRKVEMSPEEYVFGAIVLYVDIMTIFITVLSLFGLARQ